MSERELPLLALTTVAKPKKTPEEKAREKAEKEAAKAAREAAKAEREAAKDAKEAAKAEKEAAKDAAKLAKDAIASALAQEKQNLAQEKENAKAAKLKAQQDAQNAKADAARAKLKAQQDALEKKVAEQEAKTKAKAAAKAVADASRAAAKAEADTARAAAKAEAAKEAKLELELRKFKVSADRYKEADRLLREWNIISDDALNLNADKNTLSNALEVDIKKLEEKKVGLGQRFLNEQKPNLAEALLDQGLTTVQELLTPSTLEGFNAAKKDPTYSEEVDEINIRTGAHTLLGDFPKGLTFEKQIEFFLKRLKVKSDGLERLSTFVDAYIEVTSGGFDYSEISFELKSEDVADQIYEFFKEELEAIRKEEDEIKEAVEKVVAQEKMKTPRTVAAEQKAFDSKYKAKGDGVEDRKSQRNAWVALQDEKLKALSDFMDKHRAQFPDEWAERWAKEHGKIWTVVQTRFLKHRFRIEEPGNILEATELLRQEAYRAGIDVFDPDAWKAYKLNPGVVQLEPNEEAYEASKEKYSTAFDKVTQKAEEQQIEREDRAFTRYKANLKIAIKNNPSDLPNPDEQYEEEVTPEEGQEGQASPAKDKEIEFEIKAGKSLAIPDFETLLLAKRYKIILDEKDLMEDHKKKETTREKQTPVNDFDDLRTRIKSESNELKRERLNAELYYMRGVYIKYTEETIDRILLAREAEDEKWKSAKQKVDDFNNQVEASNERKREREQFIAETNEQRKKKLAAVKNRGITRRKKERSKQTKKSSDKVRESANKQKKKERVKRKKSERENGIPKETVDAITRSSASQNAVSIALTFRDLQQERFQNDFDTSVNIASYMNTLDAVPEMFAWERKADSNFEIPTVKLKTRTRDTGARTPAEVKEPKEWTDTWPISEMEFTKEQHALLFVRKSIAMPSAAELAEQEEGEEAEQEEEGEDAEKDADAAAKEAERQEQVDRDRERDQSKRNLQKRLNEDEIIDADFLLFHKPYARCLIAEHLISLKEQHKWTYTSTDSGNSSVEYVDVAGAVGFITKEANAFGEIDAARLSSAVNELLPSFEAMLRYRNTSLKVKEIELNNELQSIGEGGQKTTQRTTLVKNLEAVLELEVDDVWGSVAAKRMIQSEYGHLPGQLYTPQPYQLPLRISAPPRVGKSATALLMASLAKRMGMVSMYSVFPNKLPPIAEMSKKLHRLGWRGEIAMEAVKTEAVKAARGQEATNTQPRIEPVENALGRENKHTRMRFNWMTIDDLIRTGTTDESVFGTRGDTADLVLYSSTQAADCVKVGAALATWRKTKRIVFHIRDEAQSLSQGLKNTIVPSHVDFIPPPQALQFLRYYYGNLFGLNCLVTATMFPTLLEEDLWGFFGSISQNARAGLPLSASLLQVQNTLGFKYLPKVLPAIKPYVSTGYIGVDHLEEWKYTEDVEEIPLSPEITSERSYLVNGNRVEVHSVTGRKAGTSATLQYGAAHTGIPSETTLAFQQERKLQNDARKKRQGKTTKKQQQRDDREQAIYNQQEREEDDFTVLGDTGEVNFAYTGQKTRRSNRRQPVPQQQPQSSGTTGEEREEEEEEEEEEEYVPQSDEKLSKRQCNLIKMNHINNDKAAIDMHFCDWFDNANEDPVHSFRGDKQAMPSTNDKLVPMYLGALNSNVQDEQMVSFIEHFGTLVHNRVKKARRTTGATARTRNYSPTNVPDDTKTPSDKYGVAFLLYQSVMKNREAIKKATSRQATTDVPAKDPIRFHDDAEIKDDNGKIEGSGWKPGEGASSTPNYVLTAFIYDPNISSNLSSNEKSENQNAPPAFQVIRFPNAESAIRAVWQDKSPEDQDGGPARRISKIAILGYNMLSAGLTVQTVIGSPVNDSTMIGHTRGKTRARISAGTSTGGVMNRIYCAQYLALATSKDASLDKTLQLAGRTFAELKKHEAPLGWKIKLLSVENSVDTLQRYSEMEEILADINTPKALLDQRRRVDGLTQASGTPPLESSSLASEAVSTTRALTLCEALKESFDATLVASNKYGNLGTVGVRRGDFSSILGLTSEVAARRAKAAKEARERAVVEGIKDREGANAIAREILADALRESAPSPQGSTSQGGDDEDALRETTQGLVGVINMVEDDEDGGDGGDGGDEDDVAMQEVILQAANEAKRERNSGGLPDSKRPRSNAEPPTQPSAKKLGKRKAIVEAMETIAPGEDPGPSEPDEKAKKVVRLGAAIAEALRMNPNLPMMIASANGKVLRVMCHLIEKW